MDRLCLPVNYRIYTARDLKDAVACPELPIRSRRKMHVHRHALRTRTYTHARLCLQVEQLSGENPPTNESIASEIAEMQSDRNFPTQGMEEFEDSDVLVSIATFHYGKKEENPVDFV